MFIKVLFFRGFYFQFLFYFPHPVFFHPTGKFAITLHSCFMSNAIFDHYAWRVTGEGVPCASIHQIVQVPTRESRFQRLRLITRLRCYLFLNNNNKTNFLFCELKIKQSPSSTDGLFVWYIHILKYLHVIMITWFPGRIKQSLHI